MKKNSIVKYTLCVIFSLLLITCSLEDDTKNQTPVADDFEIGNLYQTAGSVTAVTVMPKTGKSDGVITVYYEGTSDTAYTKSQLIPQATGSYSVTFDIAAVTGWNAATSLYAGTLTIINLTPVAEDFDFVGLTQTYDGNPKTVHIMPKTGKTDGAISIFYGGNSTAPVSAGEYPVTFNVSASTDWNSAIDLSAGDLIISPRSLTISGVSTVDRAYVPGLTTITLLGGVFEGILAGDTVGFTLGAGTMENADAGNGKAVTANIQLTGASAGNYSLTQPPGITVNISKADGAPINAPEPDSKTLNSIAVKPVPAPVNGQTVEYAKSTANTEPSSGWQDEVVFSGLNGNTIYYIFARAKENNNYNAGTAASTGMTTLSSFTMNFEQIADDDAVLPWTGAGDPITIPHTSGANITITLDNFSQYSLVEWYIPSMSITQTNTASFELKPSDFKGSDIGAHSLTVEVVKDGVPYNRTIPFQVNEE